MQEVRYVTVFTSSPDCTPRVFVYRETWDDTLVCWRRGRAVTSHRWNRPHSEILSDGVLVEALHELGFVAPTSWDHWQELDPRSYAAIVVREEDLAQLPG